MLEKLSTIFLLISTDHKLKMLMPSNKHPHQVSTYHQVRLKLPTCRIHVLAKDDLPVMFYILFNHVLHHIMFNDLLDHVLCLFSWIIV
uniref:Uncharacterized protein n=1 Tax=Arion vulgaris TaxID=1028688 RepID=A0A0B6ZRV8_9EUPU